MNRYVLKLYVTGDTPRSRGAVANLKRLCRDELHGECDIVVVDVLNRPELAESEKIMATPTLIKQQPRPVRRIIGDLSDTRKVLSGLDIQPGAAVPPERDA